MPRGSGISTSRGCVLVVEDDERVRHAMRKFLRTREFEVLEAGSCAETRKLLSSGTPDVAVVDYLLPDGNALDVLPAFRDREPPIPAIVLTGHGSIELAVQAVKAGAENFLTKPAEMPVLALVIERAIEAQRDRRHRMAEKARSAQQTIDPFVGPSAEMGQLAAQARQVLHADSPILLLGETGTGKTVLAAWLHRNGPWSAEPFVDLNCAAVPGELLEAELFGYERGAFTGAVSRKAGLLEIAHRGTLFLDEVGDLPLPLQPKLLKVLEEGRFRRLGSTSERSVDLRVVTASNQDLRQRTRDKSFRSDLYYRLCAIPLNLPPLRRRREDIPPLARSILDRLAPKLGRGHVGLSDEALSVLAEYDWPGNIRELRNVLERALLFTAGDRVDFDALLFESTGPGAETDETRLTLGELERLHIRRTLARTRGSVARAAEALGVPRSTLYQKLKRLEGGR